MELKPFKDYRDPVYPQINDYQSNNLLITKYQPEKWKYKKSVATAFLAFVLAAGDGCQTGTEINMEKFSKVFVNNEKRTDITKGTQERKSVIAPVFLHGEGMGAIGCVIINGPVFMTEHDAQEIIVREFRNRGIILDSTIEVNEIIYEDFLSDSTFEKNSFEKVKHKIHCYSKELNLGVEFASDEDFINLVMAEMSYSAYMIEPLQIARVLRDKYNLINRFNAVVFYDPVTNDIDDSKELLIKQIDDFFDWLSEQKKD